MGAVPAIGPGAGGIGAGDTTTSSGADQDGRAVPRRARVPPGRACHDDPIETTRIDRWLWAVRLAPTRSAATAECRAGHVRVNGTVAKPSTAARAGDRVEVRSVHGHRTVEVVEVIDKRVGAPVAITCYVDHTPPPPPPDATAPAFRRDPGTGRPTKRDRRDLDRLRRR
jgi:ribosome-associated heat shock protein Hsp15